MQAEIQSRSRKLFEYIERSGLEPDTLYTHQQLSEVIGQPIAENRSPIYSAIRQLEKAHNRTLICVLGVGYRVARPSESRDIVDHRVSRATRQVRRGVHTARHTDMAGLSPEERKQHDQMRSGIVALERQMKQVRSQMNHLEARVDVVETIHDSRLDRLERELAELRSERLPA
jgi:hypothetical protein